MGGWGVFLLEAKGKRGKENGRRETHNKNRNKYKKSEKKEIIPRKEKKTEKKK